MARQFHGDQTERAVLLGGMGVILAVAFILIVRLFTNGGSATAGSSADKADPNVPSRTVLGDLTQGVVVGDEGSAAPAKGPIEPVATNVPMEKLKAGEKPPQFIIFSFDGGAGDDNWQRFLEAAEVHDARFTTFLTGLYLLGDEAKEQAVYEPPGHSPGAASIGYGGSQESIVTQVENLNTAYSRGHEIGTHYNGHFCAGNPPSGDDWTTQDWDDELDQFFTMMTDWKQLNGYTDVPDLRLPAEAVKGGRTPCLEGDWDDMLPAWEAHGLTYDSSLPAPTPGISWPELRDGIWEFYMPYAYSPAFGMTTVMDYNFWITFNGGISEPETAPELRKDVRETYDYLFEQVYNGNRAPLLVAGHFNSWNGDSFNPATADFMRAACGEPETYCATYQDVMAWMELQNPTVLEDIVTQPPVAGSPPATEPGD